ncbi:F-box and leucine-rich repeat protein 13-like isoform X2 [Phymastichus coffea]|nr:F-box and leucine-rich repeat protein 13-like isoform X2 [Phymastichus coffea]
MLTWSDIKSLRISFNVRRDRDKMKYTLPLLKLVLGHCGPFLKDLTLGSWREKGYTSPVMSYITKSCPNLISLNLKGVKLHVKSAEILAQTYSKLTHLTLGWCQQACTHAISKLFQANKELKLIEFIECYHLESSCFSKLHAESIESITFGRKCNFEVSEVINDIEKFINLKTIYVERNGLFIDGINELLGELPKKTNLENLIVDASCNYSEEFVPLSNIIYYTNLRKVTLTYRIAYDELLVAIAKHCKNLTYIKLANSPAVTDLGLSTLISSLNIEELCIDNLCEISSSFFAYVHMPSLKIFQSFNNPHWNNESFRNLMSAADNLIQIQIKNNQVNYNALINDATQYSLNRGNETFLKLLLEVEDQVPPTGRIAPYLLVELIRTRHSASDEDSD